MLPCSHGRDLSVRGCFLSFVLLCSSIYCFFGANPSGTDFAKQLFPVLRRKFDLGPDGEPPRVALGPPLDHRHHSADLAIPGNFEMRSLYYVVDVAVLIDVSDDAQAIVAVPVPASLSKMPDHRPLTRAIAASCRLAILPDRCPPGPSAYQLPGVPVMVPNGLSLASRTMNTPDCRRWSE